MWLDDLVETASRSLESERELEVLWGRGVTDEQIRLFRIGYLASLPVAFQGVKNFSSWWARGRFKDVFVFPLTNALGQVKGIQLRSVDREAKVYSDWFLTQDEPVLFGLGQALPSIWSEDKVCLVEGVFDFFPVQRVYPHTVSTLTAAVASNTHRLLKRLVKEVWFCYDNDPIGHRAVKMFCEEHLHEFTVFSASRLPKLKMPNGKLAKDPSDVWEALGDDRFGVVLRAAFTKVEKKRNYVSNLE